MPNSVSVPQFGQTVTEATVVRWLKKEGDTIAKGDILFEIETDKAVLEVESFYAGTLLKILVAAGATVPVQTTACYIGKEGEAVPASTPPPAPAPAPAKTAAAPAAAAPAAATPAPRQAPAAPPAKTGPAAAPLSAPVMPASAPTLASAQRMFISPRAAKLAKESVVSPANIAGTGPNGRIVERDVAAYLEQGGYHQRRFTPAAKALAAKEGLDLLALAPTGEGGRLLVADVERALAERPKLMSKMRQVIAERLTYSYQSTPHFFTTVSVDLSDLLELRKELKAAGQSYTVTDFLMKAVVMSLLEFPAMNSSTDGRSVSWNSRVHLGVAVALDHGLVVPAIRCADELGLAELHDEAAAFARKARDGKLTPDQMTGSTFTISNMGMLNVENFTAIINPGESAILAVSSGIKQPVVKGDAIVVRTMMKMTVSADHRIVDGATAARFVNAIKNKLEDIALWKSLT